MKNPIQNLILAFCILFANISFADIPSATGWENGTSESFQDGTGSGTRSVQSSVVKTGTYAFRVNPVGGGSGALAIGCPNAVGNVAISCNVADAYIGFHYRVDTLPASGYIVFAKPLNTGTGAGAMLHLRQNSDGTLAVADSGNTLKGTSATALSTGTWYWIEINTKPGGAAAYSLRINGVTEISGTANQGGSNFGLIHVSYTHHTLQTIILL